MTGSSSLLLWAPRILGIAVACFIGLFAFDAFGPDTSALRALGDFAVHLVPALVLLAVVIGSWKRPWIGGMVFMLLAAAYAVSVPSRPDWMLVISGPLLAVGLLFLLSWRSAKAVHRRAR
ncbi:MAG TPA: hypothetical protein VM791_06290 [Vicinamibacterales bacterium]|jgi:hypothetical protein|nr:hypothetical protein [Vicinamibacterales bacterium]